MPPADIPVSIAPPKLAATFDKKLTAGAAEDFAAALEKTLGKPYKAGRASDTGFSLTGSLEIDFDQKAKELKGKATIQVMALHAMPASATAKAAVRMSANGNPAKMGKDITELMKELAGAVSGNLVKFMDKTPPPAPAPKGGGGAAPEVFVEPVKLVNAWDDKATKAVPGWAEKAVKAGLGGDVKVVSSRAKDGFVLKPTIDPLTYDEGKGQIFVKMSVAIIDGSKSVIGSVGSSGQLSGIKADNLDKKLEKMIEVVAGKCGRDAAREIADAAKGK